MGQSSPCLGALCAYPRGGNNNRLFYCFGDPSVSVARSGDSDLKLYQISAGHFVEHPKRGYRKLGKSNPISAFSYHFSENMTPK